MIRPFIIIGFMLISLSGVGVFADDAEARREFDIGISQKDSGDCLAAADKFLAAELYADDSVLKFNALKQAASCFKEADMKYKEFNCLEKLLNNYPGEIDFKKTVEREYEIGNSFYHGKRDPALSWMPWLRDKNHAIEMYEAVLKHAPFAKFAPELRLRLASLYLDTDRIDEAAKTFRDITKMYPKAEEEKFAYFELANILIQLAERGDGDGSYGCQAQETLRTVLEKYPNDPELDWVKETLEKADKIAAERLYGLASFYNRQKKNEAAVRYLHELLTKYPDAQITTEAEKLLVSINEDYKPSISEPPTPFRTSYSINPIPEEPKKIMVVPENSGGKWLLPVEDLGLQNIEKQKD